MAAATQPLEKQTLDTNKETALAPQAPAGTLYHTPEAESFQTEQRMARLFITSGLFSDVKGTTQEQAIAQAYVKIAMGKSMGFSPVEAMQGIDIIQGRPAVSAQLRAARMQRAGFSWQVEKLDEKGCELTVFRGERALGKATFDEQDAKNMGLLGKDNWKKDPASMYFARAITRAQRRYAPGVLSADILIREDEVAIPPEGYVASVTQMPRRLSESSVAGEEATLAEQVRQMKEKRAAELAALPDLAELPDAMEYEIGAIVKAKGVLYITKLDRSAWEPYKPVEE